MTTKTNQFSGLLALGVFSLANAALGQEPATPPAGLSAEAAPNADATSAPDAAAEAAPAAAQGESAAVPPSAEPRPAPAPNEEAKPEEAKPEEAKLPIWEQLPKISFGGYVHSAFIMSDADGKVDNEFRIRKARLQLNWTQGKVLGGSVEVEMAHELDADEQEAGSDSSSPTWAPLRDAYVEVTPIKAVGVRVGQFKRPFSRIALTSSRKLKLVSRGVSDAWINGELNYGDRDVGAQLQGEVGKNWGVDYAVGLFNGTGSNAREIDDRGAKDFVGRVVGHLGKHFEIGANIAIKSWDDPAATVSYTTNAVMFGGDLAFDYKGFDAVAEGGYGDYYSHIDATTDDLKSLYVLGLLSYKIPLMDTWKLAVEPLVKGELLLPRADDSDTQVLAATVGANLHLGNLFRLMVQGDLILPNDESVLPEHLGEANELKRLTVQLALHTK
jgi:phosphate-selective porin